ncbi:hypothetical protein [Azospirillum picis]|uniref:Uncharacterized protein n=1 Tax=Azospirillum picis TaxID=488438 RepID=A0ABU0MFN1_9PROT|nr:hypothetical protein [Azospirillum picis]MBP2298226.1 hypothetical protein [Azospirillum picis]MDQ0532064.1 hypothetical protein [Azospirillum picis]
MSDKPAVPTPDDDDDRREREGDDRPDQVGIIPGKVPGRPVSPGDPRFPGSQPDLA